MNAKRKICIVLGVFSLLFTRSAACQWSAQETGTPAEAGFSQAPSDSIAKLPTEQRALFDALCDAIKQEHYTDALANGNKLLLILQAYTPLSDYVTRLTAEAAVETGDTKYALNLIIPLIQAHPMNWYGIELLARIYAENDEKTLRDQQIAHLQAMHKMTSVLDFAHERFFRIQKVKLNTGYAVFLYPFEPLKPFSSYLEALIYTSEDKEDYRIELESDPADQAFFKAKKRGERRFSIDTFRKNEKNPDWPDSQALHGFIDGVFDYDTMRDSIIKVANGDKSASK
jgi:hypothetical protein